jgi:hypothetical protein
VRQVHQLKVVTAPGSTQSSYQVNTWSLSWAWLDRIVIHVPPGHKGQTGIVIVYQGTQVIPWEAGSWLVRDGSTIEAPWQDQVMPWGLTVRTYNTGRVTHTFHLLAYVDPYLDNYPARHHRPPLPAPDPAATAAIAALSRAGHHRLPATSTSRHD